MVEPPLTFSCTKNASKLATRNQKRSLRHYSTDIGDALHFSKNSYQSDPTRPEAGKTSQKTYESVCPFSLIPAKATESS